MRSLRRLIQGLFRDLDRLAKRKRARIRLVAKDKFIIESDNPGHGFLVQFTPFFIGASPLVHDFEAEARRRQEEQFGREPGQAGRVEQAGLRPFHEAFHAVGDPIQGAIDAVFDFLEAMQRQPEIFHSVITSALFGTPGEFFEARRREREG